MSLSFFVVHGSSPCMSESQSAAVLAPQGTASASLNHVAEVVTPSKVRIPDAQIIDTPVIGRIPLPYALPLHSMRDSLKTALSEGQILTSGQRSELLEAFYLDITKYTL